MKLLDSAPVLPQKRQEVAMSQMVLPQNFPKSASSEAVSSPGAARPASEKSGDSPFDAVSRSEQKRLDAREAKEAGQASEAREARQSGRAEQAEKDRQSDAKAAKSDAERRSAEPADAAKSGGDQPAVAETSGEAIGQNPAADGLDKGDLSSDPDPLLQPEGNELLTPPAVTFAGLRTLAAPLPTPNPTAMAQGTAASATGQALPFAQNSLMSMAGVSGNGKGGSMILQAPGRASSATAIGLAENLLAGVTGDGGKASDSPMLQNAIRFQGALESVSVQANAVNAPRMAPDAPILRGYATSIDLPVSHAEWGDKVAGKLTWLTARNMSVAEIHLTPPDMGPMEVKVQVQQEQASITVHSANPVVREQLELHSHRLRDMLNEQGFALENFDVSDSGSDQTRDGDADGDERPGQGLMADGGQEETGTELHSLDLAWKGEVDIFA